MFSFFKKKTPSPPPEQDRVQESEVKPVPAATAPGAVEQRDAQEADRPVAPAPQEPAAPAVAAPVEPRLFPRRLRPPSRRGWRA